MPEPSSEAVEAVVRELDAYIESPREILHGDRLWKAVRHLLKQLPDALVTTERDNFRGDGGHYWFGLLNVSRGAKAGDLRNAAGDFRDFVFDDLPTIVKQNSLAVLMSATNPQKNGPSSELAGSSASLTGEKGEDNLLVSPCPKCGGKREPADSDRLCEKCRTPSGKIAELSRTILEHDACLKRGDEREAHYVWARLRNLNWGPIRDQARQLFGTEEDGNRLFERILSRLTSYPVERNEFLDRPVGELLPVLEAELASLKKEQTQVLAASESEPPSRKQYVTLDQMAVLVDRAKKTLERWLKDGKLPPPDVEGGGGKPHEWEWNKVRNVLKELSGRPMPERYPSLRQ